MVSCGTSQDINNPVLSGTWLITLSTNDVGVIETPMYFNVWNGNNGEYNFEAFTKKNDAKLVLGFWKSTLSRWFSKNFKYGSIMTIEGGKLAGSDSISGVLNTPFGNYNVRSKITNGTFFHEFIKKDGMKVGSIRGVKGPVKLPLRNYESILNKVIATTEDKLFDPKLLQTPAWQNFTSEMKRISKSAEDDAVFVLAFFYFSRKYLPFSHYTLYHPLSDSTGQAHENDKFVELEQKSPDVMYMNISSFAGGTEEMDSSFTQIANKGYSTLIVDLRDNSGGSIQAGMAFVRHLMPGTLYGGIFLTKKYFVSNTALPKPDEYKDFPVFTNANYHLLMEGISSYPGVCLKADPEQPVFKGKIYVLTSNNTASTCEPIVYLLKQYKLAMIVGERTAGAMLNGEHFVIDDGFELTVPTATYYTSDGYKIDKNGVEPTIKTKAADALDTVMKRIAR